MLTGGQKGATTVHVEEIAGWVPEGEQDKDRVRRQLLRLLENNHFRNSRRYPALLRFLVEETLAGRGEFLKERLIGVQVFGRPADYDTAADPVVRVTVAEIRKRIAQYYHDEGHHHEMRIEVMPGSYEPAFRLGREEPGATQEHGEAARELHTVAAAPSPWAMAPVLEKARPAGHRWAITAVMVPALLMAGMLGWWMSRPTLVEQLWAPLLASGRPVVLVLPVSGGSFLNSKTSSRNQKGSPAPDAFGLEPSSNYLQLETGGQNVVFADVLATMRVSAHLATQHAEVRLRLNTITTLDDLRHGPAVLIGGMDNQWTLRALEHLRYGFEGDGTELYWIRDRKAPDDRRWSLDLKTPVENVTHDYAIIARVHDETTGQPEMLVAGIGMSGTAGAGELLVTPESLKDLRRRIGAGAFEARDFEAVLSTDVVNGIAGSAKVIAVAVE